MDQLLAIFKQLGVDETIAHQFAIYVVIFFLLSSIFFSKLKFVIQKREEKTTGLDGSADQELQEANKLSEQYKLELNKIQSEAFLYLKTKKENALNEQKNILKVEDEKIQNNNTKLIKDFQNEVQLNKKTIFENSNQLSNELVEKLT